MSEIQTGTSRQYGQAPFAYFNGLGLSNDATTPNSIIDIAVGSCLDSTLTYQMQLSTATTVSSAFTGVGGLDTGTVAASTVYAVYLISDPIYANVTSAVLSTSLTGPLMPFGYSAWRLIGFATTDSSSHFLLGYWSDTDSAARSFVYDAPISCLSGGTQTSYTGVSLSAFVPAINNTAVTLYSNFTANAAADIQNLKGYNSTGDAVTIIAPVAGATAHTTSSDIVLAQLNSGAPSIKYKVSAGSLALSVQGYQFIL